MLLYGGDIGRRHELVYFRPFDSTETTLSSRIVKFLCEGIPFEIFCQNRPVGEQWGYVHFLAEERLLKLGGAAFAKQVQVLRAHGMKTEPAIMQALGVHAQDPYAEILRIAKFTDKKIKDLYFS